MKRILLALLALFPIACFAQTGGGFPPAIKQASTTISVGTAGVCNTTLNAGTLRLNRVGNSVTASFTVQLGCTTSAAVSSVSFSAILPAAYTPATATNGCMTEVTNSIASASSTVLWLFNTAGGVSFNVVAGGATTAGWWTAGGSCTYNLN